MERREGGKEVGRERVICAERQWAMREKQVIE